MAFGFLLMILDLNIYIMGLSYAVPIIIHPIYFISSIFNR